MSDKKTVLITGAAGNLGSKLARHLGGCDWCGKLILLDVRKAADEPGFGGKARMLVADVANPNGADWQAAVAEADAIVHFASANPAPDSSWAEAAASFDMTDNLLLHAARKVTRFIFASSNHAMGGYKDVVGVAPGSLNGQSVPLTGSHLFGKTGYVYGAAYGATKLLGERASIMAAAASGGRLTSVSTRIGWCQDGVNLPQTILPSGGAGQNAEPQDPVEEARDLKWYRNMWLSNGDFNAVFERAILADAKGWPAPGIVVNAMSNNRGMAWDRRPGRDWLGFEPKDDAWAELER